MSRGSRLGIQGSSVGSADDSGVRGEPASSDDAPESQTKGLLLDRALLQDWVTRALTSAGLRRVDAATVADSLLFADRRGIVTHGVARVPMYVQRIAAGGIRVDTFPETVLDAGAVCVVEGNSTAGAVAAVHAARVAVAKARENGIGLSLVRGANDIGALGYYATLLAADGCIGFVACNTDAVMCAPGSATPVLGNNPLAMAVPGTCVVLDMATSVAAYGKITLAKARGHTIPEHWALDESGRPTTDPAAALRGALLPAAGPKGFGLAFMIDVFAALAGANTSPFVPKFDGAPGNPQNLGLILLALRTSAVADRDVFAASVHRLIEAIHASSRRMTGEALVPGEPESRVAQSLGNSVLVEAGLVDELFAVATDLGVPFPKHAIGAKNPSRPSPA